MQQYIDFYNNHKEEIERSCHSLLNSARREAFRIFRKIGFPAYHSEDYQHINVAELLSPDFGFYFGFSGRVQDPHKVFRCNIPNLGSYLHFVINGHFYKEEQRKPFPEGVFSGSLNEFAEEYPELFKKYYNKLAPQKGGGLAAFNSTFVQDGYVLYVPKNTVIEKPIQLTNICNGTIDALINRRILIILEQGAQAKLLLCDHTSNEETNFVVTQVSELYVGENAILDFYELEESTFLTTRLTSLFVDQAASSNVMVNNISLTNGVTRNNYYIDLSGENAEAHLYGMAIADDQERIDNYSFIHHKVPHCKSNELFKYVLDGEAVGSFSGRIFVEEDAQKTQAYQDNRNLCMNNRCRMFSKPQLEIYADDVKCSHGMTTGQLDENALFYMRSRGIPEDEARFLLKLAFMMDVLDGIRIEELKDRLRLLVEKRFRGELVKCQGCI